MKKLLNLLGIDYGKLIIGHGEHLIFIETCKPQKKIWVHSTEKIVDGCCQIPISLVGTKLTADGVIFKINVMSEKLVINWLAW